MKRLVTTLSLIIGIACLGVAFQDLPTKTTKLPDGATPKMLPRALRGHSVISANEFIYSAKHMTLRVYRYSWKGDIRGFSVAMAKDWKVKPELTKDHQMILERLLKQGAVTRQAMVIAVGQAVKDDSNVYGARFIYKPGWLRVSYNEELRQKD